MKKPFLVVHNHDLLTFEVVKTELGSDVAQSLSGVLISGRKFSIARRVIKRTLAEGFEWYEWSDLVPIWVRRDITEPYCASLDISSSLLDRVLAAVLRDVSTFFVADRRKCRAHNSYVTTVEILRYIVNSLKVLHDAKPSCVLYQTTPHDLTNWVFGRVAECVGISVYILKVSPLPWRVEIKEGILDQEAVVVNHQSGAAVSDLAQEYIKKNQGAYCSAEPNYEKESKKRGCYEKWSWANEIKTNTPLNPKGWRRALSASFRKKRAYQEYFDSRSSVGIPSGSYGVFFLHYQPERTTVPEGGLYGQQLNPILLLASSLQPGETLVVKEHPSIFRRPFNPFVRPRGFYETIASIPNVLLSPLEQDTFEIIDNALFVSTITGTVGFQALCRNKPVVCFGNAPYKDAPYVFRADIEGVERAVMKAKKARLNFYEELQRYLAGVEKSSFSSDSGTGGENMSDKKRLELAHINAVRWFVCYGRT